MRRGGPGDQFLNYYNTDRDAYWVNLETHQVLIVDRASGACWFSRLGSLLGQADALGDLLLKSMRSDADRVEGVVPGGTQ